MNQLNMLTERENQCAYYLLQGMTAREIGIQLGLSPRTIESHLESMKSKLCCKNKIELIVTLVKHFKML